MRRMGVKVERVGESILGERKEKDEERKSRK